MSTENTTYPRMEGEELELLKRVLPEGYTIRPVECAGYSWEMLDEEGEVCLQGKSHTASGAVAEMLDQARRNGVYAGRQLAQREARVGFGLEDLLRAERQSLQERLDALERKLTNRPD